MTIDDDGRWSSANVTHTWILAPPLVAKMSKGFLDRDGLPPIPPSTPFSSCRSSALRWNAKRVDSPVLRNRDASAPPDQVARRYINPAESRVEGPFVFVRARERERRNDGCDPTETERARCRVSARRYGQIPVTGGACRAGSFRLRSSASPRDAARPRGLLTDLPLDARSSHRRDDYHVVLSRARSRPRAKRGSRFPLSRRRCLPLPFRARARGPRTSRDRRRAP